MKTKSWYMARASMASALAVVLLYAASIVPSGQIALICLASVSVIFVRMRCGTLWAVGVYIASAVLSLLLLPDKGIALAYALFLGYYPLFKIKTERTSGRFKRWFMRLFVFNAIVILLSRIAGELITPIFGMINNSWILLLLVLNIGFIVYDYALTQIILIYLRKIDGRI